MLGCKRSCRMTWMTTQVNHRRLASTFYLCVSGLMSARNTPLNFQDKRICAGMYRPSPLDPLLQFHVMERIAQVASKG